MKARDGFSLEEVGLHSNISKDLSKKPRPSPLNCHRVGSLGLRVESLGFRVESLGFRVKCDLAKKPRTEAPKFWLRSNLLRVLEKT